jgi:hypothetical protein
MPTKKNTTTKKVATSSPAQKVSAKKAPVTAKASKNQPLTGDQKATASNVPAKKVAKKPAVKVSVQCVCVRECSPAEAFWVNDGPILRSVIELKEALSTLTDEQYAYHTKRNGNDFATWVRDCFADAECAEKLEKASTRTGAVRTLGTVCRCK